MKAKSVITVANEDVSIVTVLQLLGVELPDDLDLSRNRKVHCPFGEVYHSDHGLTAAMRVYPDTNSAWCFSCSVYYTPVKLMAQATNVDMLTAAQRLLDRVGHRPVSMAQAWAQATTHEPTPDRALLADALKTYCRRVCQAWQDQQFDPRVAATLTRCLAILDLVTTDEDVHEWLCRCKDAMRRVLKCDQPSVSEKYDVLLQSIDQR